MRSLERKSQNYDSLDEADKTLTMDKTDVRCFIKWEPHLSHEIHNSKTHALLLINANRHISCGVKVIIFCFVEGIFLNDEERPYPHQYRISQFKRILPMLIEKVNGLIRLGWIPCKRWCFLNHQISYSHLSILLSLEMICTQTIVCPSRRLSLTAPMKSLCKDFGTRGRP